MTVRRTGSVRSLMVRVLAAVMLTMAWSIPAASAAPGNTALKPRFTNAVAMDTSPTLRSLVANRTVPDADRSVLSERDRSIRPGPTDAQSGSGAVQRQVGAEAIPGTVVNFEGLSNEDNFDIFEFRVNPPDPVGDVGPNHYVEMVNLVFGVYSKTGDQLLGPVDTGTLWAGFPIDDCTEPSGDPIVVYDQFVDRWILSQFTTRPLNFAPPDPRAFGPFYNCVAVSTTGDPTGSYHRYAFITQPDDEDGGFFFPDYPKYGVWTDSYVLTTRDFGFVDRYGISVYALEKNRMINGQPARAVQFFLEAAGSGTGTVPLNQIGDGLLPADIDGSQQPDGNATVPIVGTQDNGGGYGATFDALNIWELGVRWSANPTASLELAEQLPVASFDSIFPCAPTSRDCLPQPGVQQKKQYLDILSYRQRPTWRLAYRNNGDFETLVTSQSVEALPGIAGMRWYEVRRAVDAYTVHQQGTYAPSDGVHRWMGSVAQDKFGNMALGYSVVNGTDVFPGIRYTGRLAGDSLGQMTLGEGVVINGSGVQTATNSRWGDYTSMNVDPTDDCTFWYVNEYYEVSGTKADPRPWQTRIASFKLPGC